MPGYGTGPGEDIGGQSGYSGASGAAGGRGGGGSYEIPSGAVDGMNDTFAFTAPPILVFRNGVMELRLGSVSTNDFIFDTPPMIGDNIEGLI